MPTTCYRTVVITLGGFMLCGPLKLAPAYGELQPHIDKNSNVTWGDGSVDPNITPIKDRIAEGDTVNFYWTYNGHKHPDFGAADYGNEGPGFATFTFKPPRVQDGHNPITDWSQAVSDHGRISAVSGGAITNDAWQFFPLKDLPKLAFSIPDFGPTSGPSGSTIYTAVNLPLYLSTNPNGPLNGTYDIGQSLDGLGLSIVNGQISGVEGMYFATTPFHLDPLSATGWVPDGGSSAWLDSASFEASTGSIGIIGIHAGSAPEPSTLVLSVLGTLGMLGLAGARRRESIEVKKFPAGHVVRREQPHDQASGHLQLTA